MNNLLKYCSFNKKQKLINTIKLLIESQVDLSHKNLLSLQDLSLNKHIHTQINAKQSSLRQKINDKYKMNPQQTLQQYYEHEIQKSNQSSNENSNSNQQLLNNFKKMNRTIQQRLEYYCKLTQQYMQKVQNNFLLSFSKVFQKMGNDLMLAQQAYKNIDKQIMTKQRCVNLNQDKIFFIQQSTYYKQQFEFKSKQADKLKDKNFLLIKQNTGLKEKIFQKIQQNMFLKQKLKRISKLNLLNLQDIQNNVDKIQVSKPQSPQKQTNRMNKTKGFDKNSKKWASLGKQTQEQKRIKEEQFQKKKKNLFVDIKRQLKTRQKINLQAIVTRSFIEQTKNETNHQFRSRNKKNHQDFLKNGSFAVRLADIIENSSEIQDKNVIDSTAGSNFESKSNAYLSVRRNLHTSGQRQINHLK